MEKIVTIALFLALAPFAVHGQNQELLIDLSTKVVTVSGVPSAKEDFDGSKPITIKLQKKVTNTEYSFKIKNSDGGEELFSIGNFDALKANEVLIEFKNGKIAKTGA